MTKLSASLPDSSKLRPSLFPFLPTVQPFFLICFPSSLPPFLPPYPTLPFSLPTALPTTPPPSLSSQPAKLPSYLPTFLSHQPFSLLTSLPSSLTPFPSSSSLHTFLVLPYLPYYQCCGSGPGSGRIWSFWVNRIRIREKYQFRILYLQKDH